MDRFIDRPVWILGLGLGLDSVMHPHKQVTTTSPSTVRAAKRAFAMAGTMPADNDVAEGHDSFTGVEMISYGDPGFAERSGVYGLREQRTVSTVTMLEGPDTDGK